MKNKRATSIVKQYYKQLETEQRLMLRGYDPERIHRFRIVYKKLKAWLKMIAGLEHKSKSMIPRKLRKAYRLSGIIRDLQLQQHRISGAGERKTIVNPGYRKILQQNMKKPKERLSGLLSKKYIAKCEIKSIAAIPAALRIKDYRKFMERKYAGIQQIVMSRHLSDARLHRLRRELKELYYIQAAFRDQAKYPDISALQQRQPPTFDALSEKLGKFQDQCNAIRLLRPLFYNHLGAQEKRRLREKKKVLTAEKEVMKQLLAKDIRTIKEQAGFPYGPVYEIPLSK
eukprot:Unigene12440_Nuclearia_a/m.37800 Unigene12440_Nuclearia_a/g.37800  ORF Unigene12440_Nuclearia_a/g.37800 Unigene12440_Nuclearia_a/m.37800 type:complete len:285 (+) Unigene12440_Nuclearia_a:290-1144(+)